MYAQYGWVFRAILAVVGGIFLWFTLQNCFPVLTNGETLVGEGAYGFAMAALLPWP